MTDTPVMQITKLVEHGESEGGLFLGIKVVDRQGVEAWISIPYQFEGDFLLRLRGASELAAKARSGKHMGELAMALRIHRTQLEKDEGGDVLLRLNLTNGMNLDLSLDAETRNQIQQILDTADSMVRAKPQSH